MRLTLYAERRTMGPIDIAIIVVVLILFVVAAIRMVGTATGKRDCCSGAAKQGGASCGKKFAPARVEDTDPAHYLYAAELGIGGMSCAHCVAAVEAALDAGDGCWAEVTLAGGHALLRAKAPIDEDAVRARVEQAGYRLVSFDLLNQPA